jgi:hypothetical protein
MQICGYESTELYRSSQNWNLPLFRSYCKLNSWSIFRYVCLSVVYGAHVTFRSGSCAGVGSLSKEI